MRIYEGKGNLLYDSKLEFASTFTTQKIAWVRSVDATATSKAGVPTCRNRSVPYAYETTNQEAVVPDRDPDLSSQNTTFLTLRSGTSATGFVTEKVPHWRSY